MRQQIFLLLLSLTFSIILIRSLLFSSFLFFYLGFPSQTFTNHKTAGIGDAIYLTPLYHLHLLHRWSEYYKLNVIFKSPSKIVNRFHFKDVLPKKLCSGIVYSFKCNSCNAIYYGKTKRHFYVRAAEHMGISHLTNKRLKNVKQSAISDHMLTCVCNINFNNFTILSKDSNNMNLLIKESLVNPF